MGNFSIPSPLNLGRQRQPISLFVALGLIGVASVRAAAPATSADFDKSVAPFLAQHLKPGAFKNVVEHFEGGRSLEVGDRLSAGQYTERLAAIRDFSKQVSQVAAGLEPELVNGPYAVEFAASVAELILEGLHCHNRINRVRKSGAAKYG